VLTDYHAKYLAHELTLRRPSDSADRLATAVASAQVDLNPHQVDAALFAFRSPLSKGVLLADEVGLGKTIEAGLVMSQRWAEHKRRLLVITPSNLRKQWHQELTEKFFLPCVILESKSYNTAMKQGNLKPFEHDDTVVICSYQFARGKAADIRTVPWDLVVIDEAHRLRNVYKPSNVIANTLKLALAGTNKLLLTATPLQNSLLELYGLVSFLDEHTFGDVASFREQFTSTSTGAFDVLKARLRPVCQRTLRRQVLAYVPFTARHPLVQEFTPDQSEDQLYDLVSEYLRRPSLQALPAGQRSLITLVLRKLLASSSFAIAGALNAMSARLKARLAKQDANVVLAEELDQDYEALGETAEEWDEDETPVLSADDRAAIGREIADLDGFAKLATSIQHNAKGKSLLSALDVAFRRAHELGAARKAIIFTESRRTQAYLLRVLGDSPFADGIVLFNGSNTDERSKRIYAEWLARHQGTDRVTGSRTADMRSAIVDYFREQGRIMIATEAGAEGINLQFCSLVVNYDLPWNPQRIEQRIGRCHRYGQKHDVVVVNFVNRKNDADRRVFELLSEKFKLFEGVFGASDEVLGAIESGVDFEKRIAGIYQRCRHPEEIAAAFDELQLELSLEINESMSRTRQQLLEHFDDEVREKLRLRDRDAKESLGRTERQLMAVTRHVLGSRAEFMSDSSFRLNVSPRPDVMPPGVYELPRRAGEAHLYRLGHPLADHVLAEARTRELRVADIELSYEEHEGRISALEPLVGQSGWLSVHQLSVESLDQAEDHLIHVAMVSDGRVLDEEVSARLLTVPGRVTATTAATEAPDSLTTETLARQVTLQARIAERNTRLLEAESEKLEGWADDLKLALEREIKDMDRQIKEARRAALAAQTLEAKLAAQKEVKRLESQRNQKRRSLFEAQDAVDAKRQALIEQIEGKLPQRTTLTPLFVVRWRLC
jgi:adenine-specific DNA-methyltransferase